MKGLGHMFLAFGIVACLKTNDWQVALGVALIFLGASILGLED